MAVAPPLGFRLAAAAAEETPEAARGDARRRRVERGRHAPRRPVPGVPVRVAGRAAALQRPGVARRLELIRALLVAGEARRGDAGPALNLGASRAWHGMCQRRGTRPSGGARVPD